FVVATVVMILGSVVWADTIRLRDGSVLRGKVISYNQRKFTIVVYIGSSQSQHVISVDDIESVEFDGSEAVARVGAGGANPPGSEIITQPRSAIPREPQPANQPAEPLPTLPADTPPAGNETLATDPDTSAVTAIAEKTVSVAAAADWTSTEIRVQRGQRIVISASGEVDLGDGRRSGPDGVQVQDSRKLVTARPTGALIAVVGDDNDEFIHVGRSSEFIARHNGILFLSVNEGNLKDNAGAFVARVRILSNR
ncbi:MAG: hypothetical protein ACREEM_40235, partial [Blastocatellia bacterium]